jgi:hypothetical protein
LLLPYCDARDDRHNHRHSCSNQTQVAVRPLMAKVLLKPTEHMRRRLVAGPNVREFIDPQHITFAQ